MDSRLINMDNARVDDQRQVMEKYVQDGTCPFCPGTQAETLKPIIRRGDYWDIRENRWPYENTKLHLILIARNHCENLGDLFSEAGYELFRFIKWIGDEYNVTSGAICMRFGDIRYNGATVAHLHAHVIVPDPEKTKNKEDKVRFKIS